MHATTAPTTQKIAFPNLGFPVIRPTVAFMVRCSATAAPSTAVQKKAISFIVRSVGAAGMGEAGGGSTGGELNPW